MSSPCSWYARALTLLTEKMIVVYCKYSIILVAVHVYVWKKHPCMDCLQGLFDQWAATEPLIVCERSVDAQPTYQTILRTARTTNQWRPFLKGAGQVTHGYPTSVRGGLRQQRVCVALLLRPRRFSILKRKTSLQTTFVSSR